MMNLFNIFDPMSSNLMSLNWMMINIPLIFFISNYWMISSKWNMLWNMIIINLNNELNIILKMNIFKLNFISIFMKIFLINFMGLFSFIFTSSSHMTMNLTMSLSMWLTFMIIGWLFNMNKMFIHQLPLGTPSILMPFMVLIEFISNFIRPLTLSVRLTANMIAGHLLLTLISMNGNKLMIMMMILLIITQMSLMILELSVSMIQAYVFMILLSLYSQEI